MHHFLKQQPSLNLHNDAVIEAVIEAGRFWIARGVDGFRLDALNMGMQDPLLRDNPPRENSYAIDRPYEMQAHIHSINQPKMVDVIARFAEAFREAGGEEFFTVAEIGGADPLPKMVTYTEGHDMLSSAYSFDFIGAMKAEPAHILSTLDAWPSSLDHGYPGWALSNHDCHRVATRWALSGAPEGVAERLFALLEASLRGTVFIYQGEELGLPQADIPFERLVDPEGIANWPADQGRDGARTPMPWDGSQPHAGFGAAEPWLPVDPRHLGLSVAAQDRETTSTLAFFRRVIALRRENAVLRLGSFEVIDGAPGLIAFRREGDEGSALCAFNLTGEPLALPHGSNTDWVIAEAVNMADTGEIPDVVAPHSGFIAFRR